VAKSESAGKLNLSLIARESGVSKMTVSRVLRSESNVSPETRRAVLQVAERMGFVPSRPRRPRSDLGHYYILFQQSYSVNDAYFSGIILSIQNALFDHGCGCSFGIITEEYGDFVKLNALMKGREVSGVFVIGEIPARDANMLLGSFSDIIFIDYPGGSTLDYPYNAITTDNVYGGHQAVRHLLDLRRRRILLLAGRQGHYFTNDLLRAYQETLAEYGMAFDPGLVRHGDFHTDSGYRQVADALAEGLSFDAIFSNDEMACGAMRALCEAGRSVPDEVSIVGFDGLPATRMVTPRLTTVAVDREKMGRLAVHRLLSFEEDSAVTAPYEKISLFPKLIVRESTSEKRTAD